MINRIMVIGNSGGGKTTLTHGLSDHLKIPKYHVDSIQFLSGMEIRPHKDSIDKLRNIQKEARWIIDGYGPLDILEERMKLADKIILVDFPLWKHYFWAMKRQIFLFVTRMQRAELPKNCPEYSWKQTKKLFKTIKTQHQKMRPELLKILSRAENKHKTLIVRNQKQWDQIFKLQSAEALISPLI